MKPAAAIGGAPPTAQKPRQQTLTLILIVLAGAIVSRLFFSHHENRWETIAAGVTQALEKNDVAGVKKYQNAETATHVTASRVGRGADDLSPLGALKTVKETSADGDTRVHQFDVTFAKGTVHETIKFDPDDKIVSFRYDEPVLSK